MCKPEQKKVLTGVGFQVLTAGVLARHLLTLAREGNLQKLLEYLDDLRFTEEFAKVEDAIAAGALDRFFTVEKIDGCYGSIQDAVRAWQEGGSPGPGETRLFVHTWDGKGWPGTSISFVGKKPVAGELEAAS